MSKGIFNFGKECIDQIFILKQLSEKYRDNRKELHVEFMDLEKAYDKVCRQALWRMMHECEVDGYLIRSMSSFYNGSRACVRFGSTVGEYLEVRRELRQRCVMSP